MCPTIRSDLVYYVRHSAFKAASAGAAAARGDGAAHGEAAPSARSSSTV